MAQIRKRQTKKGPRYDVRYRLGDRTLCDVFTTRKDALDHAHKVENDRNRGWAIDSRGPRRKLREVADLWLASNPAKRANTVATDKVMLDRHILPTLGARTIGSLTPADIQGLVNTWATEAAPATVRRRFGVLRAVLGFAVANDWLGRSPCRNPKLPKPTIASRRSLHATHVAAIAEATDERYRLMVWIGATTGLRWSEVAGLRVGRVDVLARTLTVSEAVGRDAQGRPVLSAPKSKASHRTLAITPALADLLAAHLTRRGITGADADRLLFEAPGGGPMRYSNWRRRVWLAAVEAAEKRAPGCLAAGFHDLRRANATAMVAENVDVKTAQTRLGHTDPRLTLSIYAQATLAADRRAAKVVGDRLMSKPARPNRGRREGLGDSA